MCLLLGCSGWSVARGGDVILYCTRIAMSDLMRRVDVSEWAAICHEHSLALRGQLRTVEMSVESVVHEVRTHDEHDRQADLGVVVVEVCVVFFFQAEDGIRDLTVTGVQTCALPIYRARALSGRLWLTHMRDAHAAAQCFRAIESEAVALHPQVVIERDKVLAALGKEDRKSVV